MQTIKDKENNTSRLVVVLPKQKHQEIRIAAVSLGLSIKDFIDEAVREKIERERNKNK